MTSDKLIDIEKRMFTPEFYRRDFSDNRAATDFLGITPSEWGCIMESYEESLYEFLYTMRVEDVKEHLVRNPHEPLQTLASMYRFRSMWHLLWQFYLREKCTPRKWADRNGLRSSHLLTEQNPQAMNAEEHQHLIEELGEERHHLDTIFLRKHRQGWIAYEHSALLLSHYFTPIELSEAIIPPAKLVCALWQGTISTHKSANERVFLYSSDTPDRMTIQCPAPLTEEQADSILKGQFQEKLHI